MLFALKIKLAAALAATAVPVALAVTQPATQPHQPDGFVTVSGSSAVYRMAGDFTRGGKPTDAPRGEIGFAAPTTIMRQQVSVADYARCVDAGRCAPPATLQPGTDLPVTGVNYHDALNYAAWLSERTGIEHRLPTDEEWVRAAAERAPDEVVPLVDPADPAQAWLARYDAEAQRAASLETAVRRRGSFGANSQGVEDVAGNVWEWTSTCFIRATLAAGDVMTVTNRNCGVRVVEGAHRSYLTDFIRDPRSGGCAYGAPPSNLGFRLVAQTRAPARPLHARVFAALGFMR